MRGSAPTRRRALLALAAAAGFALAAPASAADQTFPVAELMAEPPLPDMWVGSKDAPVTIIEYASMTCTHCAAFHAETWPTLKTKYIETGKVRFVLREFPLDPRAGWFHALRQRPRAIREVQPVDGLWGRFARRPQPFHGLLRKPRHRCGQTNFFFPGGE